MEDAPLNYLRGFFSRTNVWLCLAATNPVYPWVHGLSVINIELRTMRTKPKSAETHLASNQYSFVAVKPKGTARRQDLKQNTSIVTRE